MQNIPKTDIPHTATNRPANENEEIATTASPPRRCLGCGAAKPPSDFDKSHRRGGKLRLRCRECITQGVTPTSEKKCTRCGVVKPLDRFRRNHRRRDGREGRCKECRRVTAARATQVGATSLFERVVDLLLLAARGQL